MARRSSAIRLTDALSGYALAVVVAVPTLVLSGTSPQLIDGNPSCADLSLVSVTKFDGPVTPGTKDGVTLTLDGTHVGWSSSDPIHAVIVKGGANANAYHYEGSTGDAGLSTPINPRNDKPFGVSHVEFCRAVATEQPTPDPTPEPTEEPTEAPTLEPTVEPTPEPTEEPTEAPTEEPTEAPTEEPTEAPTEQPTPEPTEEPTEAPTEEPTVEPTEQPALESTAEPTEDPTEDPTDDPTDDPTNGSTPDPSVGPTIDASVTPSPTASVLGRTFSASGGDTVSVLGRTGTGTIPLLIAAALLLLVGLAFRAYAREGSRP